VSGSTLEANGSATALSTVLAAAGLLVLAALSPRT
jgi:hypothetical protein